ncbi:hypothetical protein, partial [Cellulomonas biazotea]
MTTAAPGPSPTTAPVSVVGPASVLRLHVLTTTPQGDRVVVGRPDTGRFVALPAVGADALALLGEGRSVQDVERALTPPDATEPVDVLAFARSLVALGFVAAVDEDAVAPADAPAEERPPGGWVVAPRARARW